MGSLVKKWLILSCNFTFLLRGINSDKVFANLVISEQVDKIHVTKFWPYLMFWLNSKAYFLVFIQVYKEQDLLRRLAKIKYFQSKLSHKQLKKGRIQTCWCEWKYIFLRFLGNFRKILRRWGRPGHLPKDHHPTRG